MQTLWKKTRAYKTVLSDGANNRFGHAYMLIYGDARNLNALLKTFAKLFFTQDTKEREYEERISRLIDTQSFADCHFFPEEGKRFSVEDAEKIAEECTLKPVEGDKKLFVIGDFSEATAPAQNKLLKLLEEPPKGVIFLLGTSLTHSVLPTVLSRVKKLEIPPFSLVEIVEALSRVYGNRFAQSDYTLCAVASDGSLGRAQDMLEGGTYKAITEEAFGLCLGDEKSLPARVKRMGETKRKKELLSLIRLIFRDGLVCKKALKKERIFLQNEEERIQKVADRYSSTALIRAQEYIAEAEEELFFNAVFPQCLEILMGKIYACNAK